MLWTKSIVQLVAVVLGWQDFTCRCNKNRIGLKRFFWQSILWCIFILNVYTFTSTYSYSPSLYTKMHRCRKGRGNGTSIVLRTLAAGSDLRFAGRQLASKVSHKPSMGRLPYTFCQPRGYLSSFRMSPLLADINLYCLTNRGTCLDDLSKVAA